MAKLEYSTNSKFNKEASRITFEINDDLTIYEFRINCIRMAAAMGYADGSIKSAFGNNYTDDIETEFNDFIASIVSGSDIPTLV
jgi:hypothetical protein